MSNDQRSAAASKRIGWLQRSVHALLALVLAVLDPLGLLLDKISGGKRRARHDRSRTRR